jgi:hypothetical protein
MPCRIYKAAYLDFHQKFSCGMHGKILTQYRKIPAYCAI